MTQSEISPDSSNDETPDDPNLDELRLVLLIETVGQLEARASATLTALEALKRSAATQHEQLVALLEAQTASSGTIVPEIEQRLVQLTARASAAMSELLPEIAQRAQSAGTPSETASSATRAALEALAEQLATSVGRLEATTSALASTPSSSGAADPIAFQVALQEQWSRWTTEHGPALAELPKLAPSLHRLELGLATTRTELLTAVTDRSADRTTDRPTPRSTDRSSDRSTDPELLDELRVLWRKQELYVLGLQSGILAGLEASHQGLRAKVREDLTGELKNLPTAIGTVVRQALGTQAKAAPSSPEVREPLRQPLVGVVILSSLTSALVTGAMWWGLQ